MSESERARANSAAASPSPGGVDPSMEDILASIRRILAEEEGAAPATPALAAEVDDGVLQLDASMMLADPIALPDASPAAGLTSPALAAPAPMSPGLASPALIPPSLASQAAPVPAAPSL